MPPARLKVDLAIVGGGVAGLYSAFRLAAAHPDWSIRLYEASSRLGGRLCSARASPTGPPIELGAFSFSDAHKNIAGLVRTLGLEAAPLQFTPGPHLLRGERIDEDRFSDPAAAPYRLAHEERGQHPRQLLLGALLRIAPELARLWPLNGERQSRRAAETARYLRTHEIADRPLWSWNLWNLLSRELSNEALEFVIAAFGCASPLRNLNASDAIWTLLWEAQSEQRHYRLRAGFQQLAQALRCVAGRNISFQQQRRLTRLDVAGGGLRLHFETPDAEDIVCADAVILALPKRALRMIMLAPALAGAEFRSDLEAVAPVPACKLFIAGRLARAHSVEGARDPGRVAAAYTDLPMRQCYRHDDDASGQSVIMACFADEIACSYWSDLVFDGAAGADLFDGLDASFAASGAMLDAARAQMLALYGEELLVGPIKAAFVDWSRDPFGGAWHVWRPGVRSWEVRERLRQPNPDLPLFVCGEAFAQTQGWCEGAINNAEMMLERHFGLSRPQWVDPDYPFET